jgi:hypothetical protein
MTLLHRLGLSLLALFGLAAWWHRRRAKQAEARTAQERALREQSDRTAAVQTEAATAARDGAAAQAAVVAAGQPREGDPVDPAKAKAARVGRAEDEARKQTAAAKVRRVAGRKRK